MPLTTAVDTAEPISGLDMGPTIAWYHNNQGALEGRIRDLFRANEGNMPATFPDMEGLDEDTVRLVRGVLSLFPESARNRSIARSIQANPPLWFHKDSATVSPRPTPNRDESLSDTAIIPSYIAYDRGSGDRLYAIIHLYDIPAVEGMSDKMRTIILTEGLIHELAHSIAIELAYAEGYALQIGSEAMSGSDVLQTFVDLTEKKKPISHYSSSYRTESGGYPDPWEDFEKWIVAVGEELAETVAAYLLGFVFCEDESRRLAPFNRENAFVRDFIRLFLEARRIS